MSKKRRHSLHRSRGFCDCPEGDAVLARMTNLTSEEIFAVCEFVCASVADGTWALIDDFFCFNFLLEANALTGFKSKTATNNGATKTANGFSFDGNDYIQSAFSPNIDGNNYSRDNAIHGCYVYADNLGGGDNAHVEGMRDAVGTITECRVAQFNGASLGLIHNTHQTNVGIEGSADCEGLQIAAREDSANMKLYTDGIQSDTVAGASKVMPDIEFYIGARNNDNSPDQYFKGVISSFIAGAAVGFNHASHYSNLLNLLADLEVARIVNRMPNALSDSEISAIRVFIRAEMLNGNYWLYDEFYCFGFSNEANALTGWFSKTATNNGATKVSTGFDFNGTSDYIDSNFNPNGDYNNASLNNALISSYLYSTNPQVGSGEALIACLDGANRVQLNKQGTNEKLSYFVNSALGKEYNGFYINQSLYSVVREQASTHKLYVDGSQVDSDADASSAAPNQNLYIGAYNVNGSDANHLRGVVSSVLVSAAIGFNHSDHNTNLNTLLTSLGVI